MLLVGPALAALTALLLMVAAPLAARADTVKVAGPNAFTGIASDSNDNVYWALPSATEARVVGLSTSGQQQSEVTFDASVKGLQGLAYRSGILYIADISGGPRESVKVYRMTSPSQGSRPVNTYTMRYVDGAHDAAAFLLSPKGNFYVVTRGEEPGIYRANSRPQKDSTVSMSRVGDAPASVTDGTFLPNGSQMALRATDGVHLVDAYTFEAKALGQIPGQPQGEAITTTLDDSALMSGNGGAAPTMISLAVPTGFTSPTPTAKGSATAPAPKPSGSASAPASKKPAPSSAPPTNAPNDGILGGQSKGTWMAVGGAGLVAVCAGLATLVGRGGRPEDGAHSDDAPADDASDEGRSERRARPRDEV